MMERSYIYAAVQGPVTSPNPVSVKGGKENPLSSISFPHLTVTH